MALMVSKRGLIAALSIIAFLVFALPPGLAMWINQRRVSRAETLVHNLALALATETGTSFLNRSELHSVGLLTGPGDPIVEATDRLWLSTRSASLASHQPPPALNVTPDPWARPLVVNISRLAEGGPIWVLSAGPNGVIETPFLLPEGAQPSGDDIVARVP